MNAFRARALVVGFGMLTGCGATVDERGAPGDSGKNTSEKNQPDRETKPQSLTAEGSYDVMFSSVTVTAPKGSSSPGDPPAPPSRTTPFRLDLTRDAGGKLQAVITSRWGTTAPLEVSETASAIAIKGAVSCASAPRNYEGANDTWKTWTLPRNADGTLAGSFDAQGEQMIFRGDVAYTMNLEGRGRFSPDVTAPELRAHAKSRVGPKDRLLPWDAITVELAEPLDRERTKAALSLMTRPAGVLPMAFEPSSPTIMDWAGVTRLVAHATSWQDVEVAWTLQANAITDRAGKESVAGPVGGESFTFLSTGVPNATIGFDDDIVRASLWGASSMLGGGIAGTNDSRCEGGGCAKLEKSSLNSCGSESAGFAARLTRGAAGRVEVRYRVLVQPKYPTSTTPSVYGAAFNVELASENGPVTDTSIAIQSSGAPNGPALTKLATPIDGHEWATPWTTFEGPIPAGTGLGVAISTRGPYESFCGGPALPDADIVVLIERVSSL